MISDRKRMKVGDKNWKQRIQQLTDKTEHLRENNKDWKQGLEEN